MYQVKVKSCQDRRETYERYTSNFTYFIIPIKVLPGNFPPSPHPPSLTPPSQYYDKYAGSYRLLCLPLLGRGGGGGHIKAWLCLTAWCLLRITAPTLPHTHVSDRQDCSVRENTKSKFFVSSLILFSSSILSSSKLNANNEEMCSIHFASPWSAGCRHVEFTRGGDWEV